MKKLPTVKLQGKDYVLVKDRVLHYLESGGKSIVTDVTFFPEKGIALVKAVIELEHIYVGHSMGPIDAEKSLEKLESVAVGRALAFAGIGIVESISSADEMNVYNQRQSNAPTEAFSKTESVVPESNLKACDKCNSAFKLIPSGTSKAGKPYGSFYACENRDCKRTIGLSDAQMWSKKEDVPLPTPFN